jgi:protein O-GlcNAc transferase
MANAEDLLARAWQHYRARDSAAAERACLDLLDLQPLHADALYLLGVLALDAGRAARAVRHFHHAVAVQPRNAVYQHALGEAFRAFKDPARAVLTLRAALALDPKRAASYNALGMALMDQLETEVAVAMFRQAIDVDPSYERAHLNLGQALQKIGALDEAAECYAEAIRLKPDYAIAHNNLGALLQTRHQHADAAVALRRALAIDPHYPEAHYNLGVVLQSLDAPAAACASHREAIRLRPGYSAAHLQLGAVLEALGRHDEAAECYRTALRIDAHHGEAYQRLGNLLMLRRDWDAARQALERATALLPDSVDAFASLIHVRQMQCDWADLEADSERLWQRASARLGEGKPSGVPPFFATGLPWSADRLLAVARGEARALAERRHRLQPAPFMHPRTRSGRLRVGYVSGDFRDHAVAHLMQGVFRLHDRRTFEIYAYSFGPDDGSSYRRQIATDCEHFVDVAGLTIPALAQRIAADGVDVLIDLMGYSGFHRLEAFALRPAPMQATYLGYPGTTGADFIDYLIGDPTVAGPEVAPFLGEKLLLLPHTYQATDNQQPIAATPPSRSAHGLPERAFVFCSFNNAYKFEPRIFGVWTRIMQQVPDSVLWLLSAGPSMESNLRHEAARRGVAPERLRFAAMLPKPEHLARLQLADLLLDTHDYNAHVSASDALWVGLPVMTCPGQTFASRVAASLLSALGLPGLIAADFDAYERLAVRLAQQPDELRRLRERLTAQRATAPLFDTPRFVRNLERAYLAMWDGYAAGNEPPLIEIRDDV